MVNGNDELSEFDKQVEKCADEILRGWKFFERNAVIPHVYPLTEFMTDELEMPKGILVFDSEKALKYFSDLWDKVVKSPTITNHPPPYLIEFPRGDEENEDGD